MGVNENTVSRILNLHNEVSEEAITQLQTASGCIFNLQWLRGESDVMLADDVDNRPTPVVDNLPKSTHIDQGSLMNATIAAQQTSIESLKRELNKAEESSKRELAAKEETISVLRGQLATKDAQLNDKDAYIETLKQQVADLRAALAEQQKKGNYGKYPFTPGAADEGRRVQV
jgi:predicted RNase H-like nuclease (RuvC/YqgF family)